jgi:carbon storage regulator CsrA
MLVLTRRVGESLIITHKEYPEFEMEVSIKSMKGGQVKISIKADKNVVIMRNELLQVEK